MKLDDDIQGFGPKLKEPLRVPDALSGPKRPPGTSSDDSELTSLIRGMLTDYTRRGGKSARGLPILVSIENTEGSPFFGTSAAMRTPWQQAKSQLALFAGKALIAVLAVGLVLGAAMFVIPPGQILDALKGMAAAGKQAVQNTARQATQKAQDAATAASANAVTGSNGLSVGSVDSMPDSAIRNTMTNGAAATPQQVQNQRAAIKEQIIESAPVGEIRKTMPNGATATTEEVEDQRGRLKSKMRDALKTGGLGAIGKSAMEMINNNAEEASAEPQGSIQPEKRTENIVAVPTPPESESRAGESASQSPPSSVARSTPPPPKEPTEPPERDIFAGLTPEQKLRAFNEVMSEDDNETSPPVPPPSTNPPPSAASQVPPNVQGGGEQQPQQSRQSQQPQQNGNQQQQQLLQQLLQQVAQQVQQRQQQETSDEVDDLRRRLTLAEVLLGGLTVNPIETGDRLAASPGGP